LRERRLENGINERDERRQYQEPAHRRQKNDKLAVGPKGQSREAACKSKNATAVQTSRIVESKTK
jgi:hypothetical protein